MSQKSLIYAFVARGNVVLAEYTEFSGNFNSIAYQCLQKLPASNNKFTYNCDAHTFNYLVDNDESSGRQIPMAFLERVKDEFVSKYGGGKAATAPANGLNKEFGPKLKELMQYCVDHPEEISKLAKVKAQVSEVKGVMMENIEKVLDRGEKIELLVDKTENLHQQVSVSFRFCATNVCTRLSEYGDQNAEENVAAKYEDQADCFGNTDCLDPHHSPLCLPWFQLRKMSAILQEAYITLF
ncbi:Vesicle-associated membrane protein 722 [Citrus sinensis]|uniref:Vesicle-associated membrane protein 722 n=1 Tax=Citrus sinensis TaxID=2711 RepID=A0ACB8ND41_CITSI|nr:Vesicle-associated membrane protein 722 [Citrus sinensis]